MLEKNNETIASLSECLTEEENKGGGRGIGSLSLSSNHLCSCLRFLLKPKIF